MSSPAGDRFVIEGGHPVGGEVTPSGNKNEALPLLAAALLVSGSVGIDNVPRIRDVGTLIELVRALGVSEELVDVQAGDLGGELADQVVGHPAAVLGALVSIERLGEIPELVLVGGGEEEAPSDEEAAEVEEQGEEDDTGVEIEITPAGKSTKRLTLLSGGEKSLTALAFLFAVFLARPCPFYILDEVEAALDDLNIDRFLGLLRQFSGRAQFIVVTHQKRTMEAADCLYGVSMAGDGVSKVVSRRLPGEPAERAA